MDSISALVRHRELHGYGLLDELRAIVTRAIAAPSENLCPVVVGGPDGLFLATFPPAIDFLCESLGYRVEPNGGTVILKLPTHFEAASSDWSLFQKRGRRVLELLDWATNCNSGELTLKLHRLVYYDYPLSAPFRLQVMVEWEDELGNPQTQLFEDEDYHEESPTHLVDSTGRQIYCYNDFLKSFKTRCDTACTVCFSIFRRRMLADKLKGYCQFRYENKRPMAQMIDIIDCEGGKEKVGHVSIEMGSLAHRFSALEIPQQPSPMPKRDGEGKGALAQATTGTDQSQGPAARPVATNPTTMWVEESQKPPNDDGVKYDADDYF
jgi:hypothetical protein